MKLFPLLAGLLWALGSSLQADAPPLTVAIFDFQTAGERMGKSGAEAALLLNTQLSRSPDLLLVEREEVEKTFGEQALGMTGNVSPGAAAKTGALLGAQVRRQGTPRGQDHRH